VYLDPWQGVFISLEGGEGSGKTSVAEFLHKELEDAGIPCLWVREPGSTGLGERIREILLQREGLSFGAMSELLLYLSARAQNLQENILPAIDSGTIVICDRYNDSSMAYQAAARGLDSQIVKQLCHLATKGRQPHLTLWFDVDPVIGCARAKKHKNGGDVLDRESLDFHIRVRDAYTKFAIEEPQRIVRINA
jgi:dTMP kinase